MAYSIGGWGGGLEKRAFYGGSLLLALFGSQECQRRKHGLWLWSARCTRQAAEPTATAELTGRRRSGGNCELDSCYIFLNFQISFPGSWYACGGQAQWIHFLPKWVKLHGLKLTQYRQCLIPANCVTFVNITRADSTYTSAFCKQDSSLS
jgi:hypothetical protein